MYYDLREQIYEEDDLLYYPKAADSLFQEQEEGILFSKSTMVTKE